MLDLMYFINEPAIIEEQISCEITKKHIYLFILKNYGELFFFKWHDLCN